MRIPPAASLKIDKETLLRDVRARLARRFPSYAEGLPDPTEPGWLVLEEAAWMVELLSEQLDRYPMAALQQHLHLSGAQLLPARPAVGVVVLVVGDDLGIALSPSHPPAMRFIAAQTEQREAITFVPAELKVPVRRGRVRTLCEIDDGLLYQAGRHDPEKQMEGHVIWSEAPRRTTIFDGEVVQLVVPAADQRQLRALLESGVRRLDERNIGWLSLEVSQTSAGEVCLLVRVDPSQAFARTVSDGGRGAGDVVGDWGVLDRSTWTPPVRVADHESLPPSIRGIRPLPGGQGGTILVPRVPREFPAEHLLVRDASPLPDEVLEAVWETLSSLAGDVEGTRLNTWKFNARRTFVHEDELYNGERPGAPVGEPGWVVGALEGLKWADLVRPGRRMLLDIELDSGAEGQARVAVVLPEEAALPDMMLLAADRHGVLESAPSAPRLAWDIVLPGKEGGLHRVVALDLVVPAERSGLLLVVDGPIQGAFLNALLVINAPVVKDNRQVSVTRNLPEAVSLLHDDLVTPDVLRALASGPLPASAAETLRNLPLGRIEVEGQAPIEDWRGVSVDAADGRVVLNTPDADGHMRSLRPGTSLHLTWYRRTDGRAGDVHPGAVRLVEQDTGTSPALLRVRNPLATLHGTPRETMDLALERVFGPPAALPLLPRDFERVARAALGERGRDLTIRCWTYGERTLISHALWASLVHGEAEAAAIGRLSQQVEQAGPEQLLFAVGRLDQDLPESELAWARMVIRAEIRQQGMRLPTVDAALVVRLWPLVLTPMGQPPKIEAPCFEVSRLRGRLRDLRGREIQVPRAHLLLDAAICKVDAPLAGTL